MPRSKSRPERRKIIRVNWGDGHAETILVPRLKEIPGPSVVCPPECNPVGETGDEWLKKERESRRPKLK